MTIDAARFATIERWENSLNGAAMLFHIVVLTKPGLSVPGSAFDVEAGRAVRL